MCVSENASMGKYEFEYDCHLTAENLLFYAVLKY